MVIIMTEKPDPRVQAIHAPDRIELYDGRIVTEKPDPRVQAIHAPDRIELYDGRIVKSMDEVRRLQKGAK